MTLDQLKAKLHEASAITNEQWLSSLSPRKSAELEFHDRSRNVELVQQAVAQDTYEKFYGNEKYYRATVRSKNHIAEWIQRNAPGRVFLDYACGNGHSARLAAKSGAALAIGLDISNVSIENARRAAVEEGVSANTFYFQADAENTQIPDESIDLIVCNGMLHHLDLSYAFPELRRILKVGGRILSIEALDYNPAIKLYRMLTPAMRTEWETSHILGLSDLTFARRFFDVQDVRYWHVVGYAGGKLPWLLPALDAADRVIERIPGLNLMAWIFTFELVRPAKT